MLAGVHPVSLLFFHRPLSSYESVSGIGRTASPPPAPVSVKGISPSRFCRPERTWLEGHGDPRLSSSCHRMHAFPDLGASLWSWGVPSPVGCMSLDSSDVGAGRLVREAPQGPSPFLLDGSAGGASFLAGVQSSSRLSLCMGAFRPLGLCGRSPSVRSLRPPTPSSGRCQVAPKLPPAGASFKP